MAKGKSKISSSEDLPPPQTRSLRSRKRWCPSEASLSDDVQTTFHQKDTEGDDTGNTVITMLQSPMQQCTVIISQQDQAAEQFCFTKHSGSIADDHAAVTNVNIATVVVTGQEKATVINPSNDSQFENSGLHTDDDISKREENKNKSSSEECNKSPDQAYSDQFQVFLPVSKEGIESYTGAIVKQVGGEGKSNPENIQGTNQDTASTECMSDLKESAVGLPAKKKRRMGSCALTEKERSRFLQIQNDFVDLEVNVCSTSLPSLLLLTSPGHITEQNEAEQKVQSSHCGEDGRAETELSIIVTTSDGTSTVCDPGSLEGKSFEAEAVSKSGPEIPGNKESSQLSKEEERDCMGNQELQEFKEPTAENMDEMPEKEMERGEDVTAEVHLSSAITSKTNQNEESGFQDADKVTLPEINSLNKANDEICVDSDEGASSSNTQSRGLNSGSVEVCETALAPSVLYRKYNYGPDNGPAASPSTKNDEHTQAKDPSSTFGPGCLDYVSDSQLNTIILTEEGVMTKEEEADPFGQLEDASDLVCGLIKELSSLNRKVMAAHRELDNLHRSRKISRSSVR